MPTAQIKSTVLSTVVIGSRDDVNIGNSVSLEHNGSASTFFWEFVSVPPGSAVSFSPSASSSNPSFTPDIVGSYLIKLTIDGDSSGADTRVIAVKTSSLDLRIPAAGEKTEFNNNPISLVDGWHEAMYFGFKAIDEIAGLTLKTDGSNSPTAAINWGSQKITNLAAGTATTDAARFGQIPASLSALNSKIGVTLDTTSDTRDPTAHGLGSAFHTAATLAELNALISDATLDDYGDPRTPLPHAADHYQGGSDQLVAQELSSGSAGANLFLQTDGLGGWDLVSSTPGADDRRVFVSSNDASAGFLFEKVLGGLNIDVSINDPFSDEEVLISTPEVIALPEQSSDPTPSILSDGYLYSLSVNGINELHYIDKYGTITQITDDGYLDTFNSLRGVGLFEQSADPATVSGKGYLYTKDGGGITELFYKDGAGNIVQITQSGQVITNINLDSYLTFVDIDNYATKVLLDGYASAAQLDDYLTYVDIDDYAKKALLDAYLTGASFDAYLTYADIDDYAKKSLLDSYLTGASFDAYLTYADIDSYAKKTLLDAYLTGASFDAYLTYADIDDYAKKSLLDSYLTGASFDAYLTYADIDNYAKKSLLDSYLTDASFDAYLTYADIDDYAKKTLLDSYLSSATLDNYLTYADIDNYAEKTLLDSYLSAATLDSYLTYAAIDDYAKKALLDAYLTGASFDAYLTYADIDDYAKKSLLDAYLTGASFDAYLTYSNIDDYAKKSLLDSYLTSADLSFVDAYLTFSEIDDYAKRSLLDSYLTSMVVDNYLTYADIDDYTKKSLLDSYLTQVDIAFVDNYLTYSEIDDYAKKALLDAYLTGDVLDNYLTYADIDNYATKSILDAYLTYSEIDDYAKKSLLDAYLTQADIIFIDNYLTYSEIDDYAKKSLLDAYLTGASFDAYLTFADIDDYAKKSLLDAYLTGASFDAYLTYADIDDYAKKSLLDAYLTGASFDAYLTYADIDDYAKKSLLDAYLTQTDVSFVDNYLTYNEIDNYAKKSLLDSYLIQADVAFVDSYLTYSEIDDYAKKSLLDSYLTSMVVDNYLTYADIDDYAKKSLLDSYLTSIDISFVDSYLTYSEIDDYAKKSLLDAYLTQADVSFVDNYLTYADIDDYAKKSLLDSYLTSMVVDNYLTYADIDDYAKKILLDAYLTYADIDNYTTKSLLDSYLTSADISFIDNYLTYSEIDDYAKKSLLDAYVDSYLVKVSSNDTTPGFLSEKLASGLNVELAELNDGGNEQFRVATTEVIGLPEQPTDPAFEDDYGSLYSKDVDGYTELFYIDNYGSITQITDDGYLDTFNSLRGVGLFEQSSDPTTIPGKGYLYTKDVSNISELFFKDGSGNVIQLTENGEVAGATGLHASTHIQGGSDEIDGDQLDIDFTPTNYVPSTSPSEVTDVDQLSAHFAGIDDYLSGLSEFSADIVTTVGDVVAGDDVLAFDALFAANTVIQVGRSDQLTGLGQTAFLRMGATNEPIALISVRSNGSGHISIASVADVDVSSINADHKIHSFGWTDDGNTFNEVMSIKGTGDISVASGSMINLGAVELGTGSTAGINGGVDSFVASNSTVRPMIIHARTSSGADNQSIVSVADVNASSIDADHIIHDFGWTNDSDVFTSLVTVRGDGDLLFDGGGNIGSSGGDKPNEIYASAKVDIDGYLSLRQTTDPGTLIDVGSIYTKNLDGYAELHYIDDYGNVIQVTNKGEVAGATGLHASTHIQGGADEIDGDQLDIDFTPTNYSPSTSPSEVTDLDQLSAHLAGIDNAIGSVSGTVAGNPRLPTGYIHGLNISYSSATEVNISPGVCRNDADNGVIVSTITLTADITASGANGLDTGSEGSDTTYSVWVIADTSGTNPAAALLSASETSPTLPSGYNVKRRVGWVFNNSSSDIQEFSQTGSGVERTVLYRENAGETRIVSGGNAATKTTVSAAPYVPPTSNLIYFRLLFNPSTNNSFLYVNHPDASDTSAGRSSGFSPGIGSAALAAATNLLVPCNDSQEISYRVSTGSDSALIDVNGYIDDLSISIFSTVFEPDAYGVLVSSNDTTAGYLEDKTTAGLNVSLTTLNESANEVLEIATTEVLGLPEQSSDPSNFDDYGVVYTKDLDGYTELYYLDNYGNVIKLTDGGSAVGGSGVGWTDDGSIVRLTTAGDSVAIGTASLFGSEKVRIIGDTLLEAADITRHGSTGDDSAKDIDVQLTAETTDATPTELTRGEVADDRIILANNQAMAFTAYISAYRTDATGEAAGYKFEGLLRRDASAASTTLVESSKTVLGEDTAAWDGYIQADTTAGGLAVFGTGEGSKTIRWTCFVKGCLSS